MGPWGIGTFEDELACDWLEDLFDSDPVAFFEQCLDLNGLDYLEYLDGVGVICTAEIVHALCDKPRAGLPEAVHVWLKQHRRFDAQRYLSRAIEGMHRVLSPASELWERWEDHEELTDEWFRHAADLLRRLEDNLRASPHLLAGRLGHHDH